MIDASYAISLCHLFFVLLAIEGLLAPPHHFAVLPPLAAWLAGLLGSLAVVVARRALARRTRVTSARCAAAYST